MTRKLYYEDGTLHDFTARVLEIRASEPEPAVRLDQTAFYPTGGGQPHDMGTLNAIPVVDVWEEAGTVWHRLAQPLPEGATVNGVLDGERRRDHTQQHTGQHLLSTACLRHLQAKTVGFHLGAEVVTIDLDVAVLEWETVYAIEDEVNRIIWENRPVTAQWIEADAPDVPALRKPPPTISGPLRVITVAGYDANACSGTHVTHTGEIGLLKVIGIERYKGGGRVTFLCGRRALRDYQRGLALLHAVSSTLTVGQPDLPATVERLQTEVQATRRALRQAEARLHTYEAHQLWENAPVEAGIKHVCAHWPARSFEEARALAVYLREQPHTLIALATGTGATTRLLCARSDDLPGVDAVALLRTIITPLEGRGGGAPTLAQGSLPRAPESLSELLQNVLREV